MFKPSITVHKSNDGEVKVLIVSEEAADCLQAYHECEEAGEIVYIRKGHTDKQKKVVAGEPKIKAKRRAKKRAK